MLFGSDLLLAFQGAGDVDDIVLVTHWDGTLHRNALAERFGHLLAHLEKRFLIIDRGYL